MTFFKILELMPPDQPIKPTLGRLEKIEPDAYWHDEDTEFTPWLAQAENLKLLADTIGMELEVVAEEQRVGALQVDLLCRDTVTDRWVVIENQLNPTDATHLGQLLTAAAGLNAISIIWVSSHFSAEHRAALDWLNRVTHDEFNCFGLEIELWQIGESAMAAKFNVVSQPNGWTRTISKVTEEGLSDSQRQYLEFWSGLCQQLERRGSIVKPGEPTPQPTMEFAIGRAGFRLYAQIDEASQCCLAGLRLLGEDAQPHFYLLEEEQEQLEEEMEMPLHWHPATPKFCSIACILPEVDLAERDAWKDYFRWLCEQLERFHEVFADRIKHLNASDYQPPPDYSFNPLKNPLILPN